jgi:dihydrofolate reductase
MPEDLEHFRRVTTGHAVISGRVTYDSVGKPLPKRRNIIVSRDPALQRPGAEVAPDLKTAIALARETDPEPCIIGGAQIYAEALPLATRMILTYLDDEYEGDAYFPDFDDSEWIEEDRRRGQRDPLTFVWLRRKSA